MNRKEKKEDSERHGIREKHDGVKVEGGKVEEAKV